MVSASVFRFFSNAELTAKRERGKSENEKVLYCILICDWANQRAGANTGPVVFSNVDARIDELVGW